MDCRQALFSADSGRLFVLGDLLMSGDTELFIINDLITPDQDPATALLEAVPGGGDVDGFE